MLKKVLLSLPFAISCLCASELDTLGDATQTRAPASAGARVQQATQLLAISGNRLAPDTQRNLEAAADLLDHTGVGQALQSAAGSLLSAATDTASAHFYKLRGYEERTIVKRKFTEGGWAYFFSCGVCGRPTVHMEEVEIQFYMSAEKSWTKEEHIVVHKTFIRRAKSH